MMANLILLIMILIHGLQITLWSNPGPCYQMIPELAYNSTNIGISLPEIILIDFNGIISMRIIRDGLSGLGAKVLKKVRRNGKRNETVKANFDSRIEGGF